VNNSLGIRLAFPVISLLLLLGFLAFRKYNIGDSVEETKANLGIEEGR
jgi:hypothetical protein